MDDARLEAALEHLVADPGVLLDRTGEDIALDMDGQPLPDETVRAAALRMLAEIRGDRT